MKEEVEKKLIRERVRVIARNRVRGSEETRERKTKVCGRQSESKGER